MSLHQDFMYVAEKDAEIERLEEECLALENKVIALKAALRDCAVLMEYDLDYHHAYPVATHKRLEALDVGEMQMSNEQSFPLASSERTPVEHTYSLDGPRYRSLIACEAILDHLSREVLASLHLMEPLARREFGNTNYNILITTAERAREVLAQSEAAFKDKNS